MYGRISSSAEDTRNLTMYTTDEKTLCYVNCMTERTYYRRKKARGEIINIMYL